MLVMWKLGFVDHFFVYTLSPCTQVMTPCSFTSVYHSSLPWPFSAIFHLSSKEEQLQLAHAFAGLLSSEPGSMIFGTHIGSAEKNCHWTRHGVYPNAPKCVCTTNGPWLMTALIVTHSSSAGPSALQSAGRGFINPFFIAMYYFLSWHFNFPIRLKCANDSAPNLQVYPPHKIYSWHYAYTTLTPDVYVHSTEYLFVVSWLAKIRTTVQVKHTVRDGPLPHLP